MKFKELHITNEYLNLDEEFYHKIRPKPLNNAKLLSVASDAVRLIGVKPETIVHDELKKYINGELFFEGSNPYAMCYAGHQFGVYVPRLGDGRAINIGTSNGWHMQLKGAGQTRYSRHGDGRAVLRSSIREYLLSEAMHRLGIPTTRALGVITSNHTVYRERVENGAIVMRLSPSWVRFGSFEYFYYKRKFSKVKDLAEYVIKESYAELAEKDDRYFLFFKRVCERTAELIAQWQAVGFNHGVMNTDNMSIAGLTIDYGPFAFLDHFDSNYICNHTDSEGRYSFGNQPQIAQWNLSRLAIAISPLVDSKRLKEETDRFRIHYLANYTALMQRKLGLSFNEEGDRSLILDLLTVMRDQFVDYTPFFRTLSLYDRNADIFESLFINLAPFKEWLKRYDQRLEKETLSQKDRSKTMLRTNPKYVLKNYMLKEAIERAQKGENEGIETLLTLANAPYDEHPELAYYAKPTPNEHRNIQLSCSS